MNNEASRVSSEAPKIIRRPQVEKMTGMARSTIYAAVQDGKFPAPIRLGERSVGWVESEVIAWINERIAER